MLSWLPDVPLSCLLSAHEQHSPYGQMKYVSGCYKHKAHLLSETAAGHAFCQKLRHLLTLRLSHLPSEQGPEIELEDLHWLVAALCTQPELWTGLQHPVSVGAIMVLRRYEPVGSQQKA